jgi:hypothetical protein
LFNLSLEPCALSRKFIYAAMIHPVECALCEPAKPIEEPCSKLQGIFEMEGVFTNLKFAR